MPQTLAVSVTATALGGANQVIGQGPDASQVAIKMLGTNGGGFINVNASYPHGNATAIIDLAQIDAILIIPAAANLIVSVRNDEREIIAALDAGADDYLTRPLATGEMLARLRALLRRSTRRDAEPAILRLGPDTIDLAARLVTHDDNAVSLMRKEFDVLALLLRHPGRLLTHRDLLLTVWGSAHVEDGNYLRIVFARLREKPGDSAADARLIFKGPGIGHGAASGCRLAVQGKPADLPVQSSVNSSTTLCNRPRSDLDHIRTPAPGPKGGLPMGQARMTGTSESRPARTL